jgi:RimJ/RimL family protein N-acetyltransferase
VVTSQHSSSRSVRLRDGAEVEVRQIEPTDSTALIRFHDALSPDSIRMRYFSAHPHLSPAETLRLTTVDHRDRQAYVAIGDGDIVAVARYERSHVDGDAEVAFIVADDWQGRGLGGILLHRLVEHARSCGFRRFTASTLPHNRAMLALFNHAGLPIEKHLDAGVVEVALSLE